MKRTLMTFSLLVLAMITFGATFDLGIKAGYNTTKISTDLNTIKADAQGGYNFGAFGRFGGKSVYLQPELLYVVKNGNLTVGAATDAIKMKTIQVPVLLGIKLIDLKIASIRAFTGPAITFVSGYDSKATISNNYKKSILDYQLGAGVDVLMFTFDVRYEWALSKNFDTTDIPGNFNNKGNTFTVSLGFKFL